MKGVRGATWARLVRVDLEAGGLEGTVVHLDGVRQLPSSGFVARREACVVTLPTDGCWQSCVFAPPESSEFDSSRPSEARSMASGRW
jgi:hypothetical protein